MQAAPLWAAVLPVVVGLLALAAAAFDSLLTPGATGRLAAASMLNPLRETARLLRQRRRSLIAADSLLWRIGGAGLVVVPLLKVVVIPFGGVVLADNPVGVVWFNAIDVMVWALFWLLGWGANSAYSLIGGYRFLSQALSYELPLMFALVCPAIAAGSLRLADVAGAQHPLWFVLWMPVAFVVYCGAVVAFSTWGPFTTAAGSDIAGGILAELSGVDRLLVLAGRYALLTAGAAFAVPMFLGGGAGPLLPGWLWVLIKTMLLLAAMVAVRRVLPTVRPERLAPIAWMIVLPLVLLQTLVVSIVAGANG